MKKCSKKTAFSVGINLYILFQAAQIQAKIKGDVRFEMTDDQVKMNAAIAQVLKQVEVNLINQTKINNNFTQVLKGI
jgi:hypothetical protein